MLRGHISDANTNIVFFRTFDPAASQSVDEMRVDNGCTMDMLYTMSQELMSLDDILTEQSTSTNSLIRCLK